MEQSSAALTLALRVLTAWNEKRHPEPADVHQLQRYAPLVPANAPVDELAREVINLALERGRKKAKEATP